MKTALVAADRGLSLIGQVIERIGTEKYGKFAKGARLVVAYARLQVCDRAHIAVTCNPPDLPFELINMRSI